MIPPTGGVFRALVCLGVLTAIGSTGAGGQSPQTQTTADVLKRWNSVFAGGAPSLERSPSRLLQDAIGQRPVGTALDLGAGQGRNAIFLATSGWTVTGVDLSDVAIDQARLEARSRQATLDLVVADLDQFDFGQSRWDLITSFYMHAWHDRSATDVPRRIVEALKPGGLLVIEGFAKPDVTYGFSAAQLSAAYSRLRILRAETINDQSDWDRGNTRHLVRFVAERVR